MIRAMIAHANTAILRSQFSVTVRLTAAANEEKEEKEKAQQQIGCAAISDHSISYHIISYHIMTPFPTTFPHDFSPRLIGS